MNTKISLFTLFACAAAGTSLLADNENHDGETIAAGTSFSGKSLVDSSWIEAIIGGSSGSVYFQGADLAGANFTNAEITNCDFSTDNTYGTTNLSESVFTGATIAGDGATYFVGATLTNANFENAKLNDPVFYGIYGMAGIIYFEGADLSGANFTNATISNCDFSSGSLFGTYRTTNLSGAVFSGATITDWRVEFGDAILTNANFENAKFGGYSAFGVYFGGADLTGANFKNAEIQNVSFKSADLTRADFRGATGVDFSSSSNIVFKNTLLADGKIEGFSMTSEEDSFSIAKHIPKEGSESVSAKLASSATISGGAVLTLAAGSVFEVVDGATLTIGENGSVVFGEDTALHFGVSESTTSSVVVADSGSVALSDTAKLIVDFSGTLSDDVSYSVMTWSNGASVSDLSALTKGSTLSLLVDGVAYADALWDFSTNGNALTIKIYSGSVDPETEITINGIDQVVNLPGTEYVGTFDASLSEFRGTISGEGSIHSGYDLTFAGDASEHTGTTYIDGGTFTIVDAAKLGTGAFEVASAGTLRIEGTRDFSNKLSGAGTLTTAGEITLSGNASAHTGTTKVESGTLSVASGATLGTGAFEVAGTLALNGTRTFKNATSGDGKIEVSTGTTTFTTDIGVKTLSVSENATATLVDGIGMTHTDANVALAGTLNLNGNSNFAATLSGAGKLNTNGNVNFKSDASAFSGTTKVEAGTLTVAESAKLGSGAFEIAGTLAIDGDRTFKNATSGNGTLKITSGETTFTQTVGVKKLSVDNGAKLRGNVKLTHGADSVLELAGTLMLDAAAGEKVSLGNGKVVIKSSAKLDLSGMSTAMASPTRAVVYDAASTESALLSGDGVTIFESGTVRFDSGANVVSFLSSDTTLRDLATRYAVVYDTTGGLSVQVFSSGTADTSIVDTHGLSASFVDWAFEKVASASLSAGIYSASEIPSADDPLLTALLSGDAGTARAILDRLSPKSYAAMIAMPVETFYDDVRSISSRLEQRRYDAPVRRGLSWEFFAQAQMISVDNDTAKSAPTFDFDRYGVFAGADVKLDPTLLVGIALGAGMGEAKIHNGGGKIESDDYRLNVFGGKTFAERFYLNAGAQLGFASYDVKRTTDYGNANASVDGWNAGAFAETGAVLTISDEYKLYAMPYFGLAYTHAATDSFKESGSDAAFDADSLAGDSLRARLGCSFSWRFDVAGARWRVGLDVAYSHELLDNEIDVDVKATDDGSKISETAKALPEDVFSIGPSVNVDFTKSASIYAGYSFNAGTDSATAHNANVGFRMRF